jgi:hypothetical protein
VDEANTELDAPFVYGKRSVRQATGCSTATRWAEDIRGRDKCEVCGDLMVVQAFTTRSCSYSVLRGLVRALVFSTKVWTDSTRESANDSEDHDTAAPHWHREASERGHVPKSELKTAAGHVIVFHRSSPPTTQRDKELR